MTSFSTTDTEGMWCIIFLADICYFGENIVKCHFCFFYLFFFPSILCSVDMVFVKLVLIVQKVLQYGAKLLLD